MNGQQVRPSRIFISNPLTANEDGPAATNPHMKRHLLLSLAATLLALPALARDFTYTYEGQTITYTVIDEDAKTCEVKAGTWVYAGNNVSGDLTIPEVADIYSVTSIGAFAFILSSGLTSITIPNSVTSIGDYAFIYCSGLTSVTIPNSVTSIGDYAFCCCSSLQLIEIPGSVKEIGTDAFVSCDKLEAINVESWNPNYKSIDGVLFDSAATTLIQFPSEKAEKEYIIPNSVTSIAHDAFYKCRGLTSVIIPNSVTSIGNSAFYYCRGLTSVTIPNAVTSIGSMAFENCSGLTSVTIPNSVTSIGDHAFKYCSSLQFIEIPGSVQKIGDNAFGNCDKLEAIKVDSSNPYFKSIDGVLFDSSATTLIQFPKGKAEKEYVIPNSVISISDCALIACSGLTSVTIPNSVTSIGGSAFEDCSGLTSVTIPNSVTSIGNYAFSNCYGLSSITSLALTPPVCGSGYIFTNSSSTENLYVPYQSVEAYKSAEGWRWFANIVGLEHDETIGGLKYILKPENKTAVVTYVEPNSLANYEGMQSVIVPETVEYDGESYTVVGIGDEAFNNCWGLKAVSLPSTLQSIGKLAFGYCTSLRSVTIPEEVTIVDNEAFTGCSALASVTIGNSVETIGDYAFFGCTGLASLHVPESVKTIGENAFMGIHWINEVHAKASEPAEAPVSAFSTNAYRNATLVVPDGSVDSYKAHPTWSNFLEIRQNSDIPTKIEVVDGAIVVKGSDNVRVYNASGAQVYSGAAGRIELPAGIYLVATDSVSKKVRL